MLLVGLLAADAPPDLVPDPAYSPRPGDDATLYALGSSGRTPTRVIVARDEAAYDACARAIEASDTKALGELVGRNAVARLQTPLPVRVVRLKRFDDDGRRPTGVLVRLLDGTGKGREVWAPRWSVRRLVTRAEAAGRFRPKPADQMTITELRRLREVVEEQMAGSDLNVARNLEKSGKPAQAIKYYEKIVRDFPASAEAEVARKRLEVLRRGS